MATDLKRFTISVTPEMEADLDAMKQRHYYRDTRNTMIQDLIIRGLEALKAEDEAKGQGQDANPETAT